MNFETWWHKRGRGNPNYLQIDYNIELDSKYQYLFPFFKSSEFATRTMPKTLQVNLVYCHCI